MDDNAKEDTNMNYDSSSSTDSSAGSNNNNNEMRKRTMSSSSLPIPIRKRSVSTHSAGERGATGLLHDLAAMDQKEEERKRKQQQRRAQKMAVLQQQQQQLGYSLNRFINSELAPKDVLAHQQQEQQKRQQLIENNNISNEQDENKSHNIMGVNTLPNSATKGGQFIRPKDVNNVTTDGTTKITTPTKIKGKQKIVMQSNNDIIASSANNTMKSSITVEGFDFDKYHTTTSTTTTKAKPSASSSFRNQTTFQNSDQIKHDKSHNMQQQQQQQQYDASPRHIKHVRTNQQDSHPFCNDQQYHNGSPHLTSLPAINGIHLQYDASPRPMKHVRTHQQDSYDQQYHHNDPSQLFNSLQQQRMQYYYGSAGSAELGPLIPPSVVIVTRARPDRNSRNRSMLDNVESVFSSVRSVSTSDLDADLNDSDLYLKGNATARAFPERFFALIITLIFEVPVLGIISGGSDRLCSVLGRTKYQLLLAFLPLTCALSGNCGLQCSTLTTRAISYSHATSKTFMKWLSVELRSSLYLGGAMGIGIGVTAYILSNRDITFGLTIGAAQVLSIMTAGLTGTLAPLLFTFVFHRDVGKWGGLLETAIQDIVGSFTMVVLSYKLLILLGPGEVSPTDVCGGP